MKKFFQIIGMISLICISFIFTEKTANVVKELDYIMIEIKEKSNQYKTEAIDALINENTIVPGLNGKIVDEQKSYNEMKRIGSFSSENLKFKEVIPNITIKNNYNKYIIGGNSFKKQVALIFMVNNDSNIDNITKILIDNKVKGSFFIDSVWLENNNDKLIDLINYGYTIGNLSYNNDYTHSDYIWINTIIKKIGKQRTSYCYTEEENQDILSICSLNKDYTIMPSIIVKDYPTKEIKESIKNGSIISLKVNNNIENELSTIIKYIHSKGYKIVNLEDLLSERN